MAEWFDDITQQWYSSETEQWAPIEVEEAILPLEPREDYSAPGWKDVGFEFTTGGYTAPPFEAVSFQWLSAFSAVMNLGASVTGVDYQEETHTEVKRKNIYALGYANPGWQILKGKTQYAGIRDLGGHLYGYVQATDLWAYILGRSPYEDVDIAALIEGFLGVQVPIDLPAFLGAVPPVDLSAYIDISQRGFIDLSGYIMAWHIKDLTAWIGSVHETDLPADVFGIGPVDLPAYLKVWAQADLLARLVGWAERDLGAYVSVHVRSIRDLGALLQVTNIRNLRALIKGWAREVPADLGALIDSLSFTDIGGSIFGR